MTTTDQQASDRRSSTVQRERGLRSPIVFLDTETTGLDRMRRRIWEVAAIRREIDGAETTYAAMVRDIDLAEADPAGLRVGRFYERHPRFGGILPPTVEEDMEVFIVQRLEELTRGAHLVGAVPSFDEETLANLLREHELCPSWHYHLIDVENLAAGFLGWQPPYDSDDLSAALGVEPTDERHTALGDATWTRDLYDAVMTATGAGGEQQEGRR